MPLEGITRRQMVGWLAAFGAASRARGSETGLALDHFKLRVSNLEKSAAFYYRLFGGPLAEIQGGSYLTPPDMRAILLKIGSGKTYMILSPPDSKAPVGLEHVAIDAAGMAAVKQNHIPLAFSPERYVRDPDGNLIEFVGTGYWNWPNLTRTSPKLPPDVMNRQPVFEPLVIQRIALRGADVRRAADFYRLFGTEASVATSKDRRTFDFQGTALELVKAQPASGLDGFTVAVRNFDPASARRALQSLGIGASDWNRRGLVSFRDPDGNWVDLA